MSYTDPKSFLEKELRLLAELRGNIDALRESQRKTDEQLRQTDKVIKQTNKQLGELGNKFGSFAEGMALPSMVKVLGEKFGVLQTYPRATGRLNGEALEIDVLACGREPDAPAYIVEVKSHLTSAGIKQILKTIASFPKFFPEHAQRPVYGILAAVDSPANVRKEALKEGLYLAHVSDEVFTLHVPRGFKPKVFGPFKHNGQARRKGRK